MPTQDGETIRSLLARVAQTADSAADLLDYLVLFSDDAEWVMGATRLAGRAALREAAEARRASGRAGPGTASRHLVSTTAVTVDGDVAVATSYWQFFVSTSAAPALDSMGAYRDTLVRAPHGWQIARREVTLG